MMVSFWDPVIRSLWIAGMATVFSGLIGTIAAFIMARRSAHWKTALEIVFLLPLILPPSVVGFILLTLLGSHGSIGQWLLSWFGVSITFTVWAAVIAAAVVAFPLMYQTAKTGLDAIETDVLEAGRIDGAGGWQQAVAIQLPLARKAVAAGIILTFARSLSEFGATLMVAGNIPGRTQTIATAIYLAVQTHQLQLAWLWVIVAVGFSVCFLIFIRLLQYR